MRESYDRCNLIATQHYIKKDNSRKKTGPWLTANMKCNIKGCNISYKVTIPNKPEDNGPVAFDAQRHGEYDHSAFHEDSAEVNKLLYTYIHEIT